MDVIFLGYVAIRNHYGLRNVHWFWLFWEQGAMGFFKDSLFNGRRWSGEVNYCSRSILHSQVKIEGKDRIIPISGHLGPNQRVFLWSSHYPPYLFYVGFQKRQRWK